MRDKIPVHESSGNVFADLGVENPDGCLAKSKLDWLLDRLRTVDHEALFLLRKGRPPDAMLAPCCRQLQDFVAWGLVELNPTLTESGHAVLCEVVRRRKEAGR